jgi:hypothetical protein
MARDQGANRRYQESHIDQVSQDTPGVLQPGNSRSPTLSYPLYCAARNVARCVSSS